MNDLVLGLLMASINELISKMSEKDVYSVLCGYLYELKNIPEFTLLSELAFTLDCDSFLQLINCFGGQTIKIPTVNKKVLIAKLKLSFEKAITKIEYCKTSAC